MSFRALEFSFKRHHYTIGKIVEDVCVAIWNKLFTKHMPIPNKEDYLKISSTFEVLWNFPHVVGCLDGKHLRVKCPEKSGSMFFNYKGYYSIVLQGVADVNYKFIFVDVGAYGKQSDSGTFLASDVYDILDNYKNSLPLPTKIKDTEIVMPYVMLADDAYPLKEYILKPYSKRKLTYEEIIFNYRLSRCRRCVECAFGIMCTKWRLLYLFNLLFNLGPLPQYHQININNSKNILLIVISFVTFCNPNLNICTPPQTRENQFVL
ncbi:protein ALP1-like, partial [Aphis craccivora]